MNSAEWEEPEITINGVELSIAQRMTIRVAINHMAMDLSSGENPLGDDATGVAIAKGYLARISEINSIISRAKSIE